MHNSKTTRSSKEAKTGQIIRIEHEQLNRHLNKKWSEEPWNKHLMGC